MCFEKTCPGSLSIGSSCTAGTISMMETHGPRDKELPCNRKHAACDPRSCKTWIKSFMPRQLDAPLLISVEGFVNTVTAACFLRSLRKALEFTMQIGRSRSLEARRLRAQARRSSDDVWGQQCHHTTPSTVPPFDTSNAVFHPPLSHLACLSILHSTCLHGSLPLS